MTDDIEYRLRRIVTEETAEAVDKLSPVLRDAAQSYVDEVPYPPIPPSVFVTVANAYLDAEHPLMSDRIWHLIRVAADELWREWTAGKAVVELPEPDGISEDGDPMWVGDAGSNVEAYVVEGAPIVCLGWEERDADVARDLAARLLAASTRAHQLKAEEVSDV